MDAYADVLKAIDDYRRELLCEEVKYWRDGVAISLDAMPARSRIAALGTGDAIYESLYRDFIVARTDLSVSGKPFYPEPGDVIEYNDSRWEVLPDANACWTPCEPTQTFIRVHTRRLQV